MKGLFHDLTEGGVRFPPQQKQPFGLSPQALFLPLDFSLKLRQQAFRLVEPFVFALGFGQKGQYFFNRKAVFPLELVDCRQAGLHSVESPFVKFKGIGIPHQAVVHVFYLIGQRFHLRRQVVKGRIVGGGLFQAAMYRLQLFDDALLPFAPFQAKYGFL